MKQYLENMRRILETGYSHPARTASDRISAFGLTEVYNLQEGFPLVTTRHIPFKTMVKELLWFIAGGTNITDAIAPKKIWDLWAVDHETVGGFLDQVVDAELEKHRGETEVTQAMRDELRSALDKQMHESAQKCIGSIGSMYGAVWRNAPNRHGIDAAHLIRPIEQLPSDKLANWLKEYEEYCYLSQTKPEGGFEKFAQVKYLESYDQINELLCNLKDNPHSSRHMVTAFLPDNVPPESMNPRMAALQGFGSLAPCHPFFQCFVRHVGGDKYLDLQMYQRSADYPVGRPYNIAQYALLTHLLAHCTGMKAGVLSLPVGDAHVYVNQVQKLKEQLLREPFALPTIHINPDVTDLFIIKPDDIELHNYQHHGKIDYEVSQ